MQSSNTQKNIDKAVNEGENNNDKVYTPALLKPRYLLPAIVGENNSRNWSTRKIVAGIAITVVVVGLIALYLHGSTVATTL